MDLTPDLQDALSLPELVNGEPSAATPAGLTGSSKDQDWVMQELGQTVTNLALTQGWSLAGAAAGTTSPEYASLGTVSAKAQELVPELPPSGTLTSQSSNTEAGSGDLAPAGLLTPATSEGEPEVNDLQTRRSRNFCLWPRRLSPQPKKRVQTMKMT